MVKGPYQVTNTYQTPNAAIPYMGVSPRQISAGDKRETAQTVS